jgi:hypothetical protein
MIRQIIREHNGDYYIVEAPDKTASCYSAAEHIFERGLPYELFHKIDPC